MRPAAVYFVPVVDVSWQALGPLNPRKNFSCPPPPLAQCARECEDVVDFFDSLFGGTIAVAVYTGTYCRDAFSAEPFLSTWRRAIRQGGEILIHTHEEIARVGTRNNEKNHMYQVIRRQHRRLTQAGIQPVGFRGGLYGYNPFLTPLLAELQLKTDFSAAPGIYKPDRAACWQNAPFSAFPLREGVQSPVLEIPLGADGLGSENENYLYVDYDLSSLDNAKRIYDCVLDRYQKSGRPQIIHTLFHTFSMSSNSMVERFRQFAGYICRCGAQPVSAAEARKIYESRV